MKPKKTDPELGSNELEWAAMRAVAADSPQSQRQLAATLGVSVGKTNFLLKALLVKGLLKVENFRRNDNKLGYLYLLTPQGIKEKARLTQEFLLRKEAEYRKLQQQIQVLRHELENQAIKDSDGSALS